MPPAHLHAVAFLNFIIYFLRYIELMVTLFPVCIYIITGIFINIDFLTFYNNRFMSVSLESHYVVKRKNYNICQQQCQKTRRQNSHFIWLFFSKIRFQEKRDKQQHCNNTSESKIITEIASKILNPHQTKYTSG